MAVTTQYLDSTNDKFLKILFRAGYAVQSREVNALQTILQKQVSSIGDHLFKEGAAILGGSVRYDTATALLIESTYGGGDVDLADWVSKEIEELDVNGTPTGATGKIITTTPETTTDPMALYFEPTSVTKFSVAGTTVRIAGESTKATIKTSADPIRKSLYMRLLEGVFYFDKRFIPVDSQIIVFSKFDDTFSGYVGLEYIKTAVTELSDSSLYDPSRGSSNYNAPGAHREQYIATLTSYTYSDTVPDNFVAYAEFQSGVVKSITTSTDLNIIGDILARRTNDESGSYVVDFITNDLKSSVDINTISVEPSPLAANTTLVTTAIPHGYRVGDRVTMKGAVGADAGIYNGTHTITDVPTDVHFNFVTNTPSTTTETGMQCFRTDYFGLRLSPGKAYVKGYEIELPSATNVEIRKARDVETQNNHYLTASYGSYVLVNTVSGVFDSTTLPTIDLRNAATDVIGSARLRAFVHDTGDVTTGNYRAHLYDVKIDSGYNASEVVTIKSGTSTASVVGGVGKFKIKSADLNALVFPINDYAVSTIAPNGTNNTTYMTKVSSTLASVANVVTFVVSGDQKYHGATGVELAGTDFLNEHFMFVNNASGAVIAPSSAVIAGSGQSITANVGVNASITLVASVIDKPSMRTKTLTQGSITVANGTISSSARTVSLNVSDVFRIKGIYDSGAIGTAATTSHPNVTGNFTFDNGQRDAFYDHGSVTLNGGVTAPIGELLIEFEYFTISGDGYFASDSYNGINLDLVPNYTFQTTNQTVNLRNVIDFRPVRQAGVTSHANDLIPVPHSTVTSDFNFYLGRKDNVILSKNGAITTLEGVSSRSPVYPSVDGDSVLLYKINISPYTANYATDVDVIINQNRRYTMRDIGILDKRIDRLEYETSLSALEAAAKNTNVVDVSGLTRFKTGFLVDAFTGHGVGNAASADYRVAVDRAEKVLRPAFSSDALPFEINSIGGLRQHGNAETGNFVMLPFVPTLFSRNLDASKGVSVNPYLVTKTIGTLTTSPSSDYWVDQTTAPVLDVNLTGDNDTFVNSPTPIVANNAPGFGTIWNDWETTWSGNQRNGAGARTGTRTRTGTQTSISFEAVTRSLGNSLLDVNLSRFMRAITISLIANDLRPNTDLHVFVDDVSVNDMVTAGTSWGPMSEGSLRSDVNGRIEGALSIPAGVFRTGERVITITDEPNNISDNATTEASYVFAVSGLLTTERETVVSTRNTVVSTRPVSETVIVTRPRPRPTMRDGVRAAEREIDPLAQTFHVSELAFPNGLFVSDLKLFMKRKPSNTAESLMVELRTTVNGYPTDEAIPLSKVSISNADVVIPAVTDSLASIQESPTLVTFPVPIYLPPGEHSLVLLSLNAEYEAYISEMGQVRLGTDVRISKQPVLGSLFRSQNASTWTAYQNEDLMYEMNICQFSTDEASAIFHNKTVAEDHRYNLIRYTPHRLTFEPVIEKFEIRTLSAVSGATSISDYKTINPDTNYEFSDERIVKPDAQTIVVRTTVKTIDQFVSPIYDLDRNYGVVVHNKINDFGLLDSGFIINTRGSGYTNATVTITGGGGTGATADATIVSGRISEITITNAGSGYTSPPTIAIVGDGSGATVSYIGVETDPNGGNALARYITKNITLADGFETDLATIYLDVSIPSGTDIKLYSKVLSSEDTTPMQSRPWTEITSLNKRNTSTDEFVEVKFEADLSYVADTVTYPTSKTIAVKIVLLSNNTSVVPKASALRVITSI